MPPRRSSFSATLMLASMLAFPIGAASAADDGYAMMLGYLASSRIDGNAMRGTSGASCVNMAAGDFNQQANLRAFTGGGNVTVQGRQTQRDNQFDRPYAASASIGGAAYAQGSGLAAINQASGSGNMQLNAVAGELAARGIRETTDASLSSVISASAEEQHPLTTPSSGDGPRSAAVEASAMRGYQGVMQLNQAAGSGNATGNQLLLSVSSSPR